MNRSRRTSNTRRSSIFLATALLALYGVSGIADALAHPGHPHFPGVASHLPFEQPDQEGMALTIALVGLTLGASFIELVWVIVRLIARTRAALRNGFLGRLLTALLSIFFCVSLFAACSGGGGGDGDGGASAKRPGAPAVRILHAALDVEPVQLNSPSLESVTTQFGDSAPGYISYPEGQQTLILERKNAPGVVVGTAAVTITADNFYSVLLAGQVGRDNFSARVITEPESRPESGRARLQLVHGLEGSQPIIIRGVNFTLGPVDFRASSGFVDVPSGPQSFSLSSSDGRDLGTVTANLEDRGEATILIAGSSREGVLVKRVLNDLG